MTELFLATAIEDRDLQIARAVLGGLCVMDGIHEYTRVCYYSGPTQARGLLKLGAVARNPRTENQWRELHQNLARQSYIVQLRYDVTDYFLQKTEEKSNLNGRSGTLRWTDVASPNSELITVRPKVEIADQMNLPKVMADNQFAFKTEAVTESYTFYQDNVDLTFIRYYTLPPSDVEAQAPSSPPSPRAQLPPLGALQKQDPAGKWLFFVQTDISARNRPELIAKAQQDIMDWKQQLTGIIDFPILDRRVHDTRVILPNQQGAMPGGGAGGGGGSLPSQNVQNGPGKGGPRH